MSKKENFKRVLLCAIFMVLSVTDIAAYSSNSIDTIKVDTVEIPDPADMAIEKVANAIIFAESKGNLNAVNGSCCGPMQISPGMVKACNQILKENNATYRFTLKDRFNLEKSKEMFKVFNKKYNPKFNVEKAIRSWNGGLGYKIKATQKYFNRVMAYYNSHK